MPRELRLRGNYDIAVIGGGVQGAAVVWEAARRGYSVVLLERNDFASGVSANSLKMIHGGLRYLQNLDWVRSRESAREQTRLLELAPHWVRPLPCLMPTYREWLKSRWALRAGLWLYDHLLRTDPERRQRRGRILSLTALRQRAAVDITADMTGAALWWDAQATNSERLVLAYLWSARELGATVLNYASLEAWERAPQDGLALTVQDTATGRHHRTCARHLVDTAGATAAPGTGPTLTRGVNLILDHELGDHAVGLAVRSRQIKGHAERRLLFFAPWRDVTLAGTWYFPDRPELRECITRAELARCVQDIATVWPALVPAASVPLNVHVGRLPLAGAGGESPALLEAPQIESVPGMPVTRLTGVKYTTARTLARKVMDQVARTLSAPGKRTAARLHGAPCGDWQQLRAAWRQRYRDLAPVAVIDRLATEYGTQLGDVLSLCGGSAGRELIAGVDDALIAEIHYAVEREMALHLDDLLLRRLGIGTGRPPAAVTVQHCATVMASLLGWDDQRVKAERDRLEAHYRRIVATAPPAGSGGRETGR